MLTNPATGKRVKASGAIGRKLLAHAEQKAMAQAQAADAAFPDEQEDLSEIFERHVRPHLAMADLDARNRARLRVLSKGVRNHVDKVVTPAAPKRTALELVYALVADAGRLQAWLAGQVGARERCTWTLRANITNASVLTLTHNHGGNSGGGAPGSFDMVLKMGIPDKDVLPVRATGASLGEAAERFMTSAVKARPSHVYGAKYEATPVIQAIDAQPRSLQVATFTVEYRDKKRRNLAELPTPPDLRSIGVTNLVRHGVRVDFRQFVTPVVAARMTTAKLY
jgi:hypothetical protein